MAAFYELFNEQKYADAVKNVSTSASQRAPARPQYCSFQETVAF